MRTPLYDDHVAAGGRMVDFHGWEMPVWYTGIKAEHLITREHCGLFDVSHMGEVRVQGEHAAPYLDRVLTINASAMTPGQVKYTFLLNEQGGIIDDLTVYCAHPLTDYLLCVNASNTPQDLDWMISHNDEGARVTDLSAETAMLAVQGPETARVLQQVLDFDLLSIKGFHFASMDSAAFGQLMISRTGYTGAGGVEIFLPVPGVSPLWKALVQAGATPCGLGARDTLRLEMGYPLHGNDITTETSPLEAGLGFAVDLTKPDFIGREPLLEQRRQGLSRRLCGLLLLDRGVPREGQECLRDETPVGIITSGTVSPLLGQGIALAYLDSSIEEGAEVAISGRGRNIRARVTRPPFISRGQ